MKNVFLTTVFILLTTLVIPANTQFLSGAKTSQKENASMTFINKSDYSMVVKIIAYSGELYQNVNLSPHSSRKSSFNKSATYKIKIKATPKIGRPSYHDGGSFSVTCTDTEWSEGEMTFLMSSYGSGLGPSISEKEFESNY